MKVINEYVKVNVGNQSFCFNNLILDTYLRYMAEMQEDFNNEYWQSPLLSKCYVKFGKKLEFDETSIITTDDFDIELDASRYYITPSENKNEIEYIYRYNKNFIPFYEKRITAIGFFDNEKRFCYACVNLYDYSIKLQKNDALSIVRKDMLLTEANFNSSSSNIKFPIHLLPTVSYYKVKNPETTESYPYYTDYVSAHLYSVGLGTNKAVMKKEFILDENNTEFFGEKIIFRDILNIENLLGILEPNYKYPSNNLYPVDTANDFTYVFIKYKVYYNIYRYPGSNDYRHVDTGEWYTLSIPVNASGDFDYAIKYERRDEYGI